MIYPKAILTIKNYKFTVFDNIEIKQDLYDKIYSTMSFDIAITDETRSLKKFDAVNFYYKEFSQKSTTTDLSQLNLEFIGYISSIKPDLKNKKYTISCKSLMGLAYERPLYFKIGYTDMKSIIELGLRLTLLKKDIYAVIDGDLDKFTFRFQDTNNFGELLEELQEQYVVHIFSTPTNILYVRNPAYLIKNSSVKYYEYDISKNTYDVELYDKTNDYDAVYVIGYNCVGFAYDPFAYELKNSVITKDNNACYLPTQNFTTFINSVNGGRQIDINKLNILTINRYDIQMPIEANTLALNTLLDIAKNKAISFDAKFISGQTVGEFVKLKGTQEFSDQQLWIIKHITTKFNRTTGATSTINCYHNVIQEFPEDLILDSGAFYRTSIYHENEGNSEYKELIDNKIRS